MFAVPNQQFQTVKPYIQNMVDANSKAVTDGGKGFLRLHELLKEHEIHEETKEGVDTTVTNLLPWVLENAEVALKRFTEI